MFCSAVILFVQSQPFRIVPPRPSRNPFVSLYTRVEYTTRLIFELKSSLPFGLHKRDSTISPCSRLSLSLYFFPLLQNQSFSTPLFSLSLCVSRSLPYHRANPLPPVLLAPTTYTEVCIHIYICTHVGNIIGCTCPACEIAVIISSRVASGHRQPEHACTSVRHHSVPLQPRGPNCRHHSIMSL